jgi:chloramphenicol-sensitive protein RarD
VQNLAITAGLIAINWTVYVYSAVSDQLVEASLGYYILPILSIGLGVTLLGERLSRVRVFGLVLAAIAVTVQTIAVGHLPWIALVLAFTFGIYGYLRKLTPVDPLDGLLIETLLLSPVVLGLFIYWGGQGVLAFQHETLVHDLMLVGAGPVTAIPLVCFAAGARRVRLTTLGFLQYLGPSITLLVATLIYSEAFSLVEAVTFACVWGAIATVAAEGQLTRFRLRAMAGK